MKQAPATDDVKYTNSPGLSACLRNWKISLVFTSYQSNLMYSVGCWLDQRLNIHRTPVKKPMGLTIVHSHTIYLAAGTGIYTFSNTLEPGQYLNEQFDACFVARQKHHTGYLDSHDIGYSDENGVIFVNTRYNCLATLHNRHSFTEFWRPKFITQLISEDRCHLNGMAMDNGEPRYVTAVSKSNTIDGWRDRRADGGIVIDVKTDEIVCEGLSMPHSPQMHNDQLWLLNSGTGALGYVDIDKKAFVEVAFCPGFVRGLAFYKHYAIVGLSRPRYERFEGLELDQRLADMDSEPWCGIHILDLNDNARCVEWFRIDGNISELYDVALLHGATMPMAMSPLSDEADNFITLPPESEDKS